MFKPNPSVRFQDPCAAPSPNDSIVPAKREDGRGKETYIWVGQGFNTDLEATHIPRFVVVVLDSLEALTASLVKFLAGVLIILSRTLRDRGS